MWHGKPTGRELKWEGDIMNTFDISSESMEDDLDDVSFYTGEKEFRYMHLFFQSIFHLGSRLTSDALKHQGEPLNFMRSLKG